MSQNQSNHEQSTQDWLNRVSRDNWQAYNGVKPGTQKPKGEAPR